jgi:hypothetical protein
MTTARVLTWEVMASRGYETAWAVLSGDALRARGRAVGTVPEPYWISYVLDTADGLLFDADGFVVDYPEMATRLG